MTVPDVFILFSIQIAIAVVNALHYLYAHLKVIHRDVKPSNILINRKGEVKMCDFGISGEQFSRLMIIIIIVFDKKKKQINNFFLFSFVRISGRFSCENNRRRM